MLESRRLADIFAIILIGPKSYRDLIFDSKGLIKKKLLYI